MAPYKYIIVDDDNISRTIIHSYLNDYPCLERVGSFESATAARKFLKETDVDIVFSDIEMPDMDGLALMKEIGGMVPYSVFITSHPEFALESYGLEVDDYIVKPVDEDKIGKAVERIKQHMETLRKAALHDRSMNEQVIPLKDGWNKQFVQTDDIAYLSAESDYTKVSLRSGKKIIMYGSLSSTLQNEKYAGFVRIHRSYAVPVKHIKTFNAATVTLTDKTVLPIGRAYKSDLKKRIQLD